MTAPTPPPELVTLLEDPGFTAGKKTFRAVLGALAHEELEKKVFRALERAGVGALPAIVAALGAAAAPAQRRRARGGHGGPEPEVTRVRWVRLGGDRMPDATARVPQLVEGRGGVGARERAADEGLVERERVCG